MAEDPSPIPSLQATPTVPYEPRKSIADEKPLQDESNLDSKQRKVRIMLGLSLGIGTLVIIGVLVGIQPKNQSSDAPQSDTISAFPDPTPSPAFPDHPAHGGSSESKTNDQSQNSIEGENETKRPEVNREIPPPSTEYCRLDMSWDPNLLFITCPRVNNDNAGFAMDTKCRSGEKCVYACEPPYVSTRNGFSNEDCVPYLGRCGVYDPKTYHGGVICDNGQPRLQYPDEPLCAMGLNTSFVVSHLDDVISSCQTVYPGNESPMIGIEVSKSTGPKAVTSFPQWYWQNTHAHFYVHVPGYYRDDACQWNYDPNSLNSGGVDHMPYIIGGGSLVDHPCTECGQHNLDFGENFEFQKLGHLPGFGVRVRNCNDEECGPVMCDATYTFEPSSQTLTAYWAKYNTVYASDKVGCVTDGVRGNAWTRDYGVNKYTLFEYYPIDHSGKDTAGGSDDFNPSACRMIHESKPARHGTGRNPALYICTPTGGARHVAFSIEGSNTGAAGAAVGTIAIVLVVSLSLMALTIALVFKTKRKVEREENEIRPEDNVLDFCTPDDCDTNTL